VLKIGGVIWWNVRFGMNTKRSIRKNIINQLM
jgi:hypothetical protein